MRAMRSHSGHVQARPVCLDLRLRGYLGFGCSGRGVPSNLAPSFLVRRQSRVCSTAGEAAANSTVPVVTIKMPYRVQFGEVVRVVGSSSLLGDWSADQGLQLTWTEGDIWTAEVPIRAGHYEFKCVVYNVETKSVTRWEDGGNRILNITQEPGSWDVDCQWGATADMTQAFTPAPPPPPPPVLDLVPEEPPAQEAAAEDVTADAIPAEQVPTFMALTEEAAPAEKIEDAAVAALEVPAAAAAAAAAVANDDPSAAGSGAGGAVMLLLATCAAGAVAAFALLTPGGFDRASLGGAASEVVSSTMAQSSAAGAQVRAQLAALADHVSNVQAQVSTTVSTTVTPAVAAQVSSMQGSVAEGLSSLQPMMRSGVAYVQNQASALQERALMAAAPAVAAVGDSASSLAAGGTSRQG